MWRTLKNNFSTQIEFEQLKKEDEISELREQVQKKTSIHKVKCKKIYIVKD